MTVSLRLVLALVPLGIFFLVIGRWQGGKRPKLVTGPVDFGLLAFGLGGLIVFGPVGKLVVDSVFREPSIWAWLTLASMVAMIALLYAPRTARRLVVYQVEAEELRRAVHEALSSGGGNFEPTLAGFEDHKAGLGLTVEVGLRLRIGVIEGFGRGADQLIAEITPLLRARLGKIESRPNLLATVSVTLGSLCLTVSFLPFLLARKDVQDILRAVIHRLRGG